MSKIRLALIVIVLTWIQTAVFAVPAKSGLITMRQSDGTEIKVRIIGDEHFHYYLSEDNFLLINEDDVFYYGNVDNQGNIVKSAMKAEPVSMRSAEARQFLSNVNMDKVKSALEKRSSNVRRNSPRRNPGLFDYSFPVKGDVKGLVVLVQYKDVKFKTSYDAADYFKRMMNERGFSDYGGTGCVEEYFEQQSKNMFRPHFDVYGPITLSQNMSYYGGNDWSGNDQMAYMMSVEACEQLDAEVDFSEYDTNNDGYIDNIFVFYAGQGEATGGSSNTVWPHSWNISDATSTPYYFDGVRLDRYACSNEWESGKPDGIGTFCHEFSHVMGLPDLYATSYTSAFTPGGWSVMDYGPYNNDGRTPPAYSIYERYSLDWIEPKVLDGPNSVTLSHIENSNQGCIIKTDKENEFFLLENRQQQGWDKYIPGHGMLIWHVDYNEGVWESNTVNNTSSHQYVDIEEADGTQSEYTRDGDAFPGTSKKTSFTDDTKPSMKTWGGKKLNLPITNITEVNGKIKFDVAGGRKDIPAPVAFEAENIQSTSFKASWGAVEDAKTYSLSVYTKIVSGGKTTYVYVDGYNKKSVGEALETVVEGLTPETEYYYQVFAVDGEWCSEASNEIAVMTAAPTFADLTVELLPATDVKGTSFVANWSEMPGATEYYLTLEKLTTGECKQDKCDFTGGISNLPEGWTTNSKLTYANDAYSGESKPALRLSTADSYIATPTYEEPVEAIKFWHRGSSAPEANSLYVYAKDKNANWQRVCAIAINNAAGGEIVEINSLPEGTVAVKIEYHMEEAKGAVAIDDIIVDYGRELIWTDVYGSDEPIIVNTCNVKISDLETSTIYIYNVVAFDGELFTRKVADGMIVETLDKDPYDPSTCISIAADGTDDAVTVTDLSGRVIYKGKASGMNIRNAGIYIIKGKKYICK